jgi:predicted aldo/keto reductase-like oxidoreductase
MIRREFFTYLGAAAVGMKSNLVLADTARDKLATRNTGPLPKRPYGKSGDMLSVIGFPGLVLRNYNQSYANNLIREAYERGVNYFDVAPTYGDAELKLGPALEPYRKDVFLACKSKQRIRTEFVQEFHNSLKNLRTDYFDLYQLHVLRKKEDIEQAFGPGGAVEELDKLKKSGAIRHTGFSAHNVETALMAMKYYDFDSILFPISYVLQYKGNFGEQVIDYANKRGVSVFAMKSFVRSKLTPEAKKTIYPNWWYRPIDDPEEIYMALRYSMSLPVTSLVPPGTGSDSIYKMALDLAPSFIPLTEAEKLTLKQEASKLDPLFTYPSPEFDLVKKS